MLRSGRRFCCKYRVGIAVDPVVNSVFVIVSQYIGEGNVLYQYRLEV